MNRRRFLSCLGLGSAAAVVSGTVAAKPAPSGLKALTDKIPSVSGALGAKSDAINVKIKMSGAADAVRAFDELGLKVGKFSDQTGTFYFQMPHGYSDPHAWAITRRNLKPQEPA